MSRNGSVFTADPSHRPNPLGCDCRVGQWESHCSPWQVWGIEVADMYRELVRPWEGAFWCQVGMSESGSAIVPKKDEQLSPHTSLCSWWAVRVKTGAWLWTEHRVTFSQGSLYWLWCFFYVPNVCYNCFWIFIWKNKLPPKHVIKAVNQVISSLHTPKSTFSLSLRAHWPEKVKKNKIWKNIVS